MQSVVNIIQLNKYKQRLFSEDDIFFVCRKYVQQTNVYAKLKLTPSDKYIKQGLKAWFKFKEKKEKKTTKPVEVKVTDSEFFKTLISEHPFTYFVARKTWLK